jgi:peptide/nickel transport system permease protein
MTGENDLPRAVQVSPNRRHGRQVSPSRRHDKQDIQSQAAQRAVDHNRAAQAEHVVRLHAHSVFSFSNAWPQWVLLCLLLIAVLGKLGLIGHDWTAIGQAGLSPSSQHWFGTNSLGQDLAAHSAQALANLLSDVLPGAALGFLLALGLGLWAGFQADSWIDRAILFAIDTFDSLPVMLLLIVLASVLKNVSLALPIALGLLFWSSAARAIRSACIDTLKLSFIDSARLIGMGDMQITLRQVLPIIRPVLIALGLVIAGNCLRVQLTLGFIGLDRSAKPSLGALLNSGTEEALSGRWWPLALALLISTLVLVSLEFMARRYLSRNA